MPPGIQNLDSVLKKLFPFRNRAIFININLTLLNALSRAGTGLLSRVNDTRGLTRPQYSIYSTVRVFSQETTSRAPFAKVVFVKEQIKICFISERSGLCKVSIILCLSFSRVREHYLHHVNWKVLVFNFHLNNLKVKTEVFQIWV